MWLHESESNSIITEAYENKIFLTIIYISNNSPRLFNIGGEMAKDNEVKFGNPPLKMFTAEVA